jgi:addiction module HigA family antidote
MACPGRYERIDIMTRANHSHPGAMLRELVFEPLKLTVTDAAEKLGVSRVTLSRVTNERAGISTELAIRLEKAGVSTARFWLNLQTNYELSKALKNQRRLKVTPFQAVNDVEVA